MFFLLRSALACFTRIPVGHLPDCAFAQAMRRLPMVGLVVGFLVAVAMFCAHHFWPDYLVALCGLVVWVAVTGAIHLDGVADCGDGLFMQASLERRLEVMKDPRLGAFGAITLMLMIGTKWAALYALCQISVEKSLSLQSYASFLHMASPIIFAAILGRSLTFIFMHVPSARPHGMGNSMVDAVTIMDKVIAFVLVVSSLILISMTYGVWPSMLMLVGGLSFSVCIMVKVMKTLGGVTGDVYGLIIEGTECGVLLAAAIII
ncbi:MAG: adenosylcobinamide-GDP ribazoletransferase [Pseudomonadota bacterium]